MSKITQGLLVRYKDRPAREGTVTRIEGERCQIKLWGTDKRETARLDEVEPVPGPEGLRNMLSLGGP